MITEIIIILLWSMIAKINKSLTIITEIIIIIILLLSMITEVIMIESLTMIKRNNI